MLSNVSLEYLNSYYDILGEMVHAISQSQEDTISKAFISQITPIVNASCDISRNILKYTTNLRIQNLAEAVIPELSDICEELKYTYGICGDLKNSDRDTILYKRRANAIICLMFNRAESAPVTNDLSYNFLYEIEILYMGIIETSKNLLNFTICRHLYNTTDRLMKKATKRIRQIRILKNTKNFRFSS